MYRSRLGKNLGKITLDYVSSINDDVEIAHYDILGSQAHAIMLYENKIITKNEIKKILKGLESLKKEKFDKKTNSEDIHELIESMIIKKIGIDAGGKMHTARSRVYFLTIFYLMLTHCSGILIGFMSHMVG